MSQNKVKARKIQASEVEFMIECLPEYEPVIGNALASGNDKEDRECEDQIIADLESGNEWAWCRVKVTARLGSLVGVDYLGCCSYSSQADFSHPEGYLPQMKDEALADLQDQIDKLAPMVCDCFEAQS